MWTRILLKPWWVRAQVSAGVFAVVVAAGWCARGLPPDPHESWLFTLAKHTASIVIFGLLAAAFTSNLHNVFTNALAGLDPAQRSAAVDASLRGPVPEDARVRDAAIRVAGCRIYSARSWRVMLVLIIVVAAVPLAAGAWPSWDPQDWIYAAAILGATAAAWYEWLSARRRIQTLRERASQKL
ncbi:MAG: hypothetical protein ACLPXZ_06350 [Mycobacterium sp.]